MSLNSEFSSNMHLIGKMSRVLCSDWGLHCSTELSLMVEITLDKCLHRSPLPHLPTALFYKYRLAIGRLTNTTPFFGYSLVCAILFATFTGEYLSVLVMFRVTHQMSAFYLLCHKERQAVGHVLHCRWSRQVFHCKDWEDILWMILPLQFLASYVLLNFFNVCGCAAVLLFKVFAIQSVWFKGSSDTIIG